MKKGDYRYSRSILTEALGPRISQPYPLLLNASPPRGLGGSSSAPATRSTSCVSRVPPATTAPKTTKSSSLWRLRRSRDVVESWRLPHMRHARAMYRTVSRWRSPRNATV